MVLDKEVDTFVVELMKKYPILKYFVYDHLKSEELRETSKKFHDLAWDSARNGREIPETAAGLRKLMEAKDCIVRSLL